MVPKGAGNFMQRAAQIVDTLESFMNSPDDQIEMEHVPNRWKTKLEDSTGMYPFESDGMQNISPTQRYISLHIICMYYLYPILEFLGQGLTENRSLLKNQF